MSLTASYVIVFVMIARLPLKKAPKVISYALWGVAAFRLLCPFSFESMFSLLPISSAPIPYDIAYQQSPQINSGIVAVDTYVNRSLPSPSVTASVNPLQIYILISSYIWILGIAVMLVYSVTSVLILKRRLKGAQHMEHNILNGR
jgi:beta-lactamase regulating signal transducer with metallopeptidase domain